MQTDNALSTAPASPPEAHTGNPTHNGPDGTGAASNVFNAGQAESLKRASAGAVDQHLAESTSKRGAKRPGVFIASMGDGTGETPLGEAPPEALGGGVVGVPSFDEETARKVVEIAIDLLNDGAAAIVKAIAKKETGDLAHAEEAAQSVRMSERYRETIEFGAIACARKYAVNMAYAPEMMLGGGLVLWLGQIALVVKAERAKGAEIRERNKAPERLAA